jgi:hypothetical protein
MAKVFDRVTARVQLSFIFRFIVFHPRRYFVKEKLFDYHLCHGSVVFGWLGLVHVWKSFLLSFYFCEIVSESGLGFEMSVLWDEKILEFCRCD